MVVFGMQTPTGVVTTTSFHSVPRSAFFRPFSGAVISRERALTVCEPVVEPVIRHPPCTDDSGESEIYEGHFAAEFDPGAAI